MFLVIEVVFNTRVFSGVVYSPSEKQVITLFTEDAVPLVELSSC